MKYRKEGEERTRMRRHVEGLQEHMNDLRAALNVLFKQVESQEKGGRKMMCECGKQMHDYYGLETQAYKTMKSPPLYCGHKGDGGKRFRKFICPMGHVKMVHFVGGRK
jgi:hypothetical protein